eukprot:jgi/Mesvir1/10948/Mv11489-RA.1
MVGRCRAITAKGARCTRDCRVGRARTCAQHARGGRKSHRARAGGVKRAREDDADASTDDDTFGGVVEREGGDQKQGLVGVLERYGLDDAVLSNVDDAGKARLASTSKANDVLVKTAHEKDAVDKNLSLDLSADYRELGRLKADRKKRKGELDAAPEDDRARLLQQYEEAKDAVVGQKLEIDDKVHEAKRRADDAHVALTGARRRVRKSERGTTTLDDIVGMPAFKNVLSLLGPRDKKVFARTNARNNLAVHDVLVDQIGEKTKAAWDTLDDTRKEIARVNEYKEGLLSRLSSSRVGKEESDQLWDGWQLAQKEVDRLRALLRDQQAEYYRTSDVAKDTEERRDASRDRVRAKRYDEAGNWIVPPTARKRPRWHGAVRPR